MRVQSEEYRSISQDSVNSFFKENQNISRRSILNRKWFQHFARYLNNIDSIKFNQPPIPSKQFPKILQNTIAEENSKRNIDAYFDQLAKQKKTNPYGRLKGLITDIDIVRDSISLTMIPFQYLPQIEFNHCQCESTALPITHNPFIYGGSIKNVKCTYENIATKEIQNINLNEF